MNIELKKKVESLLFSSGRRMQLNEIARLCNKRKTEEIEEVLNQLKKEYDEKDTSLKITNDEDVWKFTIRDKYIDVVRKIVSQTELTKTVMETLAVLAFKAPMMQADLIKIRTNKAYDHLKELESLGYISRVKTGRTKLIRLAPKFFEYFDIPEAALKDKFSNVSALENVIEKKESELKENKKMNKQKEKEAKEADKIYKEELKIKHGIVDKEIEEINAKHILVMNEDTGKTEKLEEYSGNDVPLELSSELKSYEDKKEENEIGETKESLDKEEENEIDDEAGENGEEETKNTEDTTNENQEIGNTEKKEEMTTSTKKDEEVLVDKKSESKNLEISDENYNQKSNQEKTKKDEEDIADENEEKIETAQANTEEGKNSEAQKKDDISKDDKTNKEEEIVNEKQNEESEESKDKKEEGEEDEEEDKISETRITEDTIKEATKEAAQKSKGTKYKSTGLFGGQIPKEIRAKVDARVAEITGQDKKKKTKEEN